MSQQQDIQICFSLLFSVYILAKGSISVAFHDGLGYDNKPILISESGCTNLANIEQGFGVVEIVMIILFYIVGCAASYERNRSDRTPWTKYMLACTLAIQAANSIVMFILYFTIGQNCRDFWKKFVPEFWAITMLDFGWFCVLALCGIIVLVAYLAAKSISINTNSNANTDVQITNVTV